MDSFEPGTGVVFMKVGTHARESLEDIIERKQQEIQRAGFALWGYGGNTCHPTTMVQPFGRRLHAMGAPLLLVMEPVNSRHFAAPVRAEEFSPDRRSWEKIPSGINALGSKYALVIDSLEHVQLELPLDATQVAVGVSAGRIGVDYIRGQVDKACLEVLSTPASSIRPKSIELVAHVASPYAVFLR